MSGRLPQYLGQKRRGLCLWPDNRVDLIISIVRELEDLLLYGPATLICLRELQNWIETLWERDRK